MLVGLDPFDMVLVTRDILLVGLFEETRPVLNRPCQEAAKDKVEGRGEVPVILRIINEEFAVRRNAGVVSGCLQCFLV